MQHSSDVGEYYSARATEYERVYAKPERQHDLELLRAYLPELLSNWSVLEIACGTGYWTEVIANTSRNVQAIDSSEKVLAIARRKKLPEGKVSFRIADAMALPKDFGTFEAAFAGFWWSHIPSRQVEAFLVGLRAHLFPGALVIKRRARACVHSVTFGCAVAGRTPQMSASLFASILQGNELHVSQRMHVSCRPSGSGDGCNPCCFSFPTMFAMTGACGTGACGYGPRGGSVGSRPASP